MAIKFIGKGLAQKYKNMARKMPDLKREVLLSVAEDAKSDFEKTVETWDNKPEFEIEERPRSFVVATDSEIYKFVDAGTRAHTIPADPFLAFRGSYQAKTTPRVIMSRSGGASGDYVYTTKDVQHPGTEAREFTKTIMGKWEKEVVRRMRDALKQGIEAVGL